MPTTDIVVRGARTHNLKNLDITIPKNKLVVITGVSGSGKSSLAFDTIYAEGQRRYIESLSAYARMFLTQMDKPDVDTIEGLSPAISIEQRTASRNPRSTVGTSTEIYDYLRLLFARAGTPHCPKCERPIAGQTVSQIVDRVLSTLSGAKVMILAPIASGKKGEFQKEFIHLMRQGFVRARIDGEIFELADEPKLDKKKKHDIDLVIDRIEVRSQSKARLADSIETALKHGSGIVKIAAGKDESLFSEKNACAHCGISLPDVTPQMFSFNSPKGACPACEGLGFRSYFDPDLVIPNHHLSLREGAIAAWQRMKPTAYIEMCGALAKHLGFDIYTPYSELPERAKEVILNGSGTENVKFTFDTGHQRRTFASPFEGVIPYLERRMKETSSMSEQEFVEQFMNMRDCPTCKGTRLKSDSLSIKIGGKNISEVVAFSIADALNFFSKLSLSKKEKQIAERILKEIRERLSFLIDVGLDYLSLDRTSTTLAGGEDQRIRLATQIGSALTGVLYVLDEPSIGLHPRDNTRLINTLTRLRDLGNTVLVVEHDREMMLAADHLVDIGPGAGVNGGNLIAEGTPAAVMKNSKSLTGQYLSGKKKIAMPKSRRKPEFGCIEVIGASAHNLKNVSVKFPLGIFTVITGVSGSGKSTLVMDTLYEGLLQRMERSRTQAGRVKDITGWERIQRIVNVDQTPIGRTPRSNPATYTGIFTHIRELYTQIPESKARGYTPGRFSFNVKGGRCEACEGDGIIKIEMHFLPDVYVECEVCQGKRFNRETLEITYKGASISDVLKMTVNEAQKFFENIPQIRHKLETIIEVGLGYIQLGQPATTLSGGEAQRLKLSRELGKRSLLQSEEGVVGKTLYILDEPTTGLHFDDSQKLLDALEKLVNCGNTVLVIEHNLDVIKFADYCIDIGPEGGEGGGRIVAVGTPEEVAENEASHTGRYLKDALLY